MNTSVAIEDGVATLTLDESIYALDAILRTSYWLTDRAYVFLSRPEAGFLQITIRPKENRPTLDNPNPVTTDTLVGEFQNMLLDHQLRVTIERETRNIRELIVTKALSGARLEDAPPGELRDPVQLAAASNSEG